MSILEVEPGYAAFSQNVFLTPTEAVPTAIGNTPSKKVTPAQAEILTHFGGILAVLLADVLDQLRAYNEEAVYPIMSILEPYMETDRDLNVRIPPKSSREVSIEVTRRGRITPKIFLDESL